VGEERVVSTGTTPEAPDLHALLALMAERGVDACSMEISSHALAQHRVDGLVVDVAGFTNLSRDHLDFHGSMDDYFAAKAALFTPAHARRAVVCVDDAWGRRLAAAAQVPVTTVTTRAGAGDVDRAADWTVVGSRLDGGLPVVQVLGPARHTPDGPVTVQVPLPGDFNVANAVLALVLLVEAGLDVHDATAALGVAGPVPGRMERVTAAGAGTDPGAGPAAGAPLAVVDYAHTPDAVGAALRALRDSGSPLVVVLGAGGDRDRDKRPLMGEAAADVADVVVVTDDNPRSEDPAAVRAAILEGARRRARATGATVVEVADRGHAVAEGVARAWGGGVLLVAGKGHEQGQEVAGTVHPFDDRDVLRAALAVAAAESVVASGVARGMREDVR
jgi:UDP-N-acetylmuramoyl-L-alanyl-D-glutamate--2,6-diaminopimelate ligase